MFDLSDSYGDFFLICCIVCTLCKGNGQGCGTGSNDRYHTVFVHCHNLVVTACVRFHAIAFVAHFQFKGFFPIFFVFDCGYTQLWICSLYCKFSRAAVFFQTVIAVFDGSSHCVGSGFGRHFSVCCGTIVCFACICQNDLRIILSHQSVQNRGRRSDRSFIYPAVWCDLNCDLFRADICCGTCLLPVICQDIIPCRSAAQHRLCDHNSFSFGCIAVCKSTFCTYCKAVSFHCSCKHGFAVIQFRIRCSVIYLTFCSDSGDYNFPLPDRISLRIGSSGKITIFGYTDPGFISSCVYRGFCLPGSIYVVFNFNIDIAVCCICQICRLSVVFLIQRTCDFYICCLTADIYCDLAVGRFVTAFVFCHALQMICNCQFISACFQSIQILSAECDLICGNCIILSLCQSGFSVSYRRYGVSIQFHFRVHRSFGCSCVVDGRIHNFGIFKYNYPIRIDDRLVSCLVCNTGIDHIPAAFCQGKFLLCIPWKPCAVCIIGFLRTDRLVFYRSNSTGTICTCDVNRNIILEPVTISNILQGTVKCIFPDPDTA